MDEILLLYYLNARFTKKIFLYFSLRRYFTQINKWDTVGVLHISVVVQFYPWFKFYFPLFWGMVIYDNEFKTKGNKLII